MLKFVGILGSALASVVIVPAATLGDSRHDSPVQSLEVALTQTVEALDLLAGIQTRANEGRPVTSGTVREISEPPIAGDEERDQKLQLLRTQVGLLQQELDILEFRMGDVRSGASFKSKNPLDQDRTLVTHGLDATALSDLRDLKRPMAPAAEPESPTEHTGYSASALLQGQACYRAGQYERGVELLENEDSIAGQYWYGRCLERAGRLEEATEVYRAVSEAEDGGSFTERAQTNLEFVQWKTRFVEKRKEEDQ
ncbi:MAG: TolA-binding protein [Planctomycetota bacterium]|jgi:TolA-binding protein